MKSRHQEYNEKRARHIRGYAFLHGWIDESRSPGGDHAWRIPYTLDHAEFLQAAMCESLATALTTDDPKLAIRCLAQAAEYHGRTKETGWNCYAGDWLLETRTRVEECVWSLAVKAA